MKTRLLKVHTVESHVIFKFDKFNGHDSMANRMPLVPLNTYQTVFNDLKRSNFAKSRNNKIPDTICV